MRDIDRLTLWQNRLRTNEAAYQDELAKMDHREALYLGDKSIIPLTRDDRKRRAVHVRNICAELVEAQVDSTIPAPKVTARHKKDEKLAKVIEDMLRNEIDRMPVEEINDMTERIVPIQGGVGFIVEWDNTKRTHTTVGEVAMNYLHPRQIIPQDGVHDGIENMDYIILKLPETKEFIKRRFGKDVSDMTEEEPDIRDGDPAEDMVTMYVAYYRNAKGGLGKFSWVRNTVLEDMEDYQARRVKRCKVCGRLQTGLETIEPTLDGIPGGHVDREGCEYCGGDLAEEEAEYEEIYEPITKRDGEVIPGSVMAEATDEDGNILTDELGNILTEDRPTLVPYYKPDIFPIVLQKNVSVYGRFLGDSDIDKVEDQQNTTNRLSNKIIDKLIQSGSYMTLPDDASIKVDSDDMKVIRPGTAANMSMINVFDLQGNVQQDLQYLQQVYEESRQMIGITDSFQGRTDRTATSGKAKEFAAAQSAGRLESKRVLKQAAYAALYEAIFKFKLAYSDEPTPVVSTDIHGKTVYDEFNRYDFLERDANGEWFYNDQFLFSCDTSAPLANNREAMWQETRLNLQTGAFGDPTNIDTLILFWTKMDALHYPGSSDTLDYLKEQKQQQMQAQTMMQRQQQLQSLQQRAMQGDPTVENAVRRQAMQDAQADAMRAQKEE